MVNWRLQPQSENFSNVTYNVPYRLLRTYILCIYPFILHPKAVTSKSKTYKSNRAESSDSGEEESSDSDEEGNLLFIINDNLNILVGKMIV